MNVDTRTCENCGAALPRTGTYCLACDTPVSESTGGLSVAETHHVKRGKPAVGIAIITACVLAVLGTAAGIYLTWRPQPEHDAAYAVRNAVTLLVSAEHGKHKPCTNLNNYLAGRPTTFRPQCRAIIGEDPGAKLSSVKTGPVKLSGKHGTVRLVATLTDDNGTRHIDEQFPVVEETDHWRLDWDGSPVV